MLSNTVSVLKLTWPRRTPVERTPKLSPLSGENGASPLDRSSRNASRAPPRAPSSKPDGSWDSDRGGVKISHPPVLGQGVVAALQGTHPTSATLKATPVDLRALSHVLMEPLADMPVGPLENSLEGAMLDIQTTQLTAYEIADRPLQYEVSGSPNTATAPSIMIEAFQASASTTAAVQAVTVVAPPIPDTFTAFFSQVSSQLSSIGSQLQPLAAKAKATNTRVDRLENPKPYSPSTSAATWRPSAPPADSTLSQHPLLIRRPRARLPRMQGRRHAVHRG
jgi:hypothetical protein